MIPLSRNFTAIAKSCSTSLEMIPRLSSDTYKKRSGTRIGPFSSHLRPSHRRSGLAALGAKHSSQITDQFSRFEFLEGLESAFPQARRANSIEPGA